MFSGIFPRILKCIPECIGIGIPCSLPQRALHHIMRNFSLVGIPVIDKIGIGIRSFDNPVMVGIGIINPMGRKHQAFDDFPFHLQWKLGIQITVGIGISVQIVENIEGIPIQPVPDTTFLCIVADIVSLCTILIFQSFIRVGIHCIFQGIYATGRHPVVFHSGPQPTGNPDFFGRIMG